MTLQNFTPILPTATVGGAPIDAFQADALRRNDVLFEKIMQALMCSPFMPSAATTGTANVEVNADSFAREFINAQTINVTTKCTLTPRVPLIWMARSTITIGAEIDASGKGAQAGQSGDFGGSGGGGATAGQNCQMPFTATEILAGGAAANVGLPLIDSWQLSRALLYLPWLIGGAAGSDAGGEGGSVVCLCAPVIQIVNPNGKINAAGKPATANNKGGGGGGLVILIARQIINAVDGTTVLVGGGAAAGGTGRAGGKGKYIANEFK